MDYGQPVKGQDLSNGYSGDVFEQKADFEPENEVGKIDRDYRNIGGNAISLSGETGDQEKENTPGLGEVVNLEMPPMSQEDKKDVKMADVMEKAIDFDEKKLNFKKFDSDGVKEVMKATNKFYQDGDAVALNDTVRGDNGLVMRGLYESFGERSAWRKAA